ncbi:IPT/TIG domain-containing protein [Psychrobacillus vulpis]|uniref:VWA domain-containing protein n=1 Tax=Psychrobacillus vulpis TaxID=2325572 RepID=A0A544TIV4_9BACI|nr:IPT/TIG domain-containing protein [Psychrobacillus vulpis]TQR17380.1 VWA domain-containing protein [Psychrobacillus vulpis]
MKLLKTIKFALIAILIIGIATPLSTEAALVNSGELMNINKTVSKNTLVKGETTDVTLTVKGTPKDTTFVKPNDVILIIDKSGSMTTDNRITAAKDAAKEFIDLMDLSKHELGIVDFENNIYSLPLTTDKEAAKNYVDTINAGGGTNTGDAIRKATEILANHRPDAQPTIIIMTDGAANSAPDALAASKAAKDAGITFYSIALLGPNEDPTTSAPNLLLMDMASSAKHHHFVLGSIGLSDVYKRIVEEIGLASAYNVKITDTIAPGFELVPGSYDNHIPRPTVTGNTIEWFISELKSDELSFTYQVRAKDDATAGKYTLAQTTTTFEIGDGSTYSLNTINPIVEIKNHAPVITSITEDKGLTTGGETVTITGQNFLPGAKVYFGSKLATVISETGTELIVTTPTGVQGPVVVKVENTDKQFATGNFNYYAIPTITSISPAEGPLGGGNQINISGSNYLKGAVVYINDVAAVTSFSSSSLLRATVPASTESGIVSIKVVNPDNTSIEQLDAYTYLAPPPPPKVELTSLSTTSGKLIGGETIILTGKNFDQNVKVYFGDNEAVVSSYISSTSIRVVVPEGVATGLVTVKVINPSNSTAELTNAYEYLAPPPPPVPVVTSLSEDSILVGTTKTIAVIGENFQRTSKVYFGDLEATSFTFYSANKVTVRIPISTIPGVVDVKVVNTDGEFGVLNNGFTFIEPIPDPAPIITSLSDTSGPMTGKEILTITGQNFNRSSIVYFGNKAGRIISISDTEITVETPATTVRGIVSVKVVNPDNQEYTLQDSYMYEGIKPTITSLTPDNGLAKGGYLVAILGTNFNNKMKVTVGGTPLTYTYYSATKIVIRMPASTPGVVDITIDLDGETATTKFTYN